MTGHLGTRSASSAIFIRARVSEVVSILGIQVDFTSSWLQVDSWACRTDLSIELGRFSFWIVVILKWWRICIFSSCGRSSILLRASSAIFSTSASFILFLATLFAFAFASLVFTTFFFLPLISGSELPGCQKGTGRLRSFLSFIFFGTSWTLETRLSQISLSLYNFTISTFWKSPWFSWHNHGLLGRSIELTFF